MSISFRSYQRLFDESSSFVAPEANEAFNPLSGNKKDAIGAMLAQEGEEKVEHAVYYLSKKLL